MAPPAPTGLHLQAVAYWCCHCSRQPLNLVIYDLARLNASLPLCRTSPLQSHFKEVQKCDDCMKPKLIKRSCELDETRLPWQIIKGFFGRGLLCRQSHFSYLLDPVRSAEKSSEFIPYSLLSFVWNRIWDLGQLGSLDFKNFLYFCKYVN